MKLLNLAIPLGIFFLLSLNLTSALAINADYITIYPGEEGRVNIEIDNNENSDIEDVSISIDLGAQPIYNELGMLVGETEALPFSIIGSSERDTDDIDEGDEEKVSFTLKTSSDIVPGDYNIPYVVKYTNAEDNEELEKTGSFGLRVSAKTELDFSAETKDVPIVDEEGTISLEIINKGLGDIKSVSVQIFPQGFELLSKDKVFIGTVSADDTDLASFDVIFKNTKPSVSVKIDYKDFDNNEQSQVVNIPLKVYTKEQALELGLIKKDNTIIYIIIVVALLIIWFVWRRIRKKRKKMKGGER